MGGTKKKVGKQRRDKAYWSAKEIGYRSRASFKLVQLNRKFEFLQRARVCLDLCAAPGSWMQVAREHMPVSSLIVGVDLVPIRPLQGCIALQGDITTEKCRADLRRELQTWKADLVLHDGAPNVGRSWIHDAYQQSLLTLHAFKLATEFLVRGGCFVTKVFRSKDYNKLLWVLEQFFKRVHSTKPAASRNESAEIFVVCQHYKAPDKIDPKFLDAKHVFSEVDGGDADGQDEDDRDQELVNPEKKKRKAPAEGYETGATVLYKKVKASEFVMGDKHVHILNNYNEIEIDEARIADHPKTTEEVRQCCADIKVLGMKEIRLLSKWKRALKEEFEAEEKKRKREQEERAGSGKKEEEKDAEEVENEEMAELESKIAEAKDEERRAAKRARKKASKEKAKTAERINLKMVIPGDEGPMREEEGLFRMRDLRSRRDVYEAAGDEVDPDVVAESDEESDDESRPVKPKTVKLDKERARIDKSGLYYKESDSEEGGDSETDEDDAGGDLGLEADDDVDGEGRLPRPEVQDEDEEGNPLLTDLDTSSKEQKRRRKADLWFQREAFRGILDREEDDDRDEEDDIAETIRAYKKKNVKILAEGKKQKGKQQESSDESEEEEDEDKQQEEDDEDFDVEESYRDLKKKAPAAEKKDGFEVVPKKEEQPKKKRAPQLTPEELALGQEMIASKKAKRDILDAGWNRFMFGDRDEDLPDWFVREERMHMKPHVESDPAVVEAYRQRQKELNVKTIKKVVEAKARKKRKAAKRMEKAKKKAAVLMENPDLGTREKAKEIQKMYKRATAEKKREVTYVVAKKHSAGKRARRPAGVKGVYRQVDPRMKKDTGGKRKGATAKRVQKRRLKGKKTRPTREQK